MSTGTFFTLTFFGSYAATSKHEERYSLASLASRIATVTASAKARLPWLKLCRFGDQRTEAGSLRNDANVLACSGLEADYDARNVSFDAAVELLCKAGIKAIIYTSPSHVPERPKWRVLCFFSEELPPAKRAHMLGRLAGLFATIGVEFSTESWTLSQSYYFGCVNHNPAHQVEIIDGTPIDLHDDLDRIWRGKPDTAPRSGGNGEYRSGRVDEDALRTALVSGENYHTASVRLVGKWAQQGVPFMQAQRWLEELFDAVGLADRDARWGQRRNDIPRVIRDIFGKEAGKKDLETNSRGVDLSPILRRRELAAELLRCAKPVAQTPIALAYLNRCGLGHLGSCPELFFHTDCPHPSGTSDRPVRLAAIIGVVRDVEGRFLAIHRTFIRADGSARMDIDPSRASLAPIMGGAVRLASLDEVLAASELVIGEGIETSASAGLLLKLPAWAAVTAHNLARGMVLPEAVKRVVIAADRDVPDTQGRCPGQEAAQAAWFRLRREGRAVRIVMPDDADTDFNDIV